MVMIVRRRATLICRRIVQNAGFGLLALTCLIALLFLAPRIDGNALQFDDAGLNLAVEAALEAKGVKKSIYLKSDLHVVQHLDASGYAIESLGGIDALTELVSLDLSGNYITDLTPLRSLKKLKELRIDGMDVPTTPAVDLEFIATLDLRKLSLCRNSIRDLAALASLTKLTKLDLRYNQIEAIESLHPLQELTDLRLADNDLNQIHGLQYLTKLQRLDLAYNPRLQDLQPICELPRLKRLKLSGIPLNDSIDQLNSVSGLRELKLRDCQLESIASVVTLIDNSALQVGRGGKVGGRIDLRDNPFLCDQPLWDEPSAEIRELLSQWQRINYREPFQLPTPTGPPPPKFSHPSGFYDTPFSVSLSALPGLEIYYTLDGSEPDPDQLSDQTQRYLAPIPIRHADQLQSRYANIHPTYEDRPWVGPRVDPLCGTVIRAVAYDPDLQLTSQLVTQTMVVTNDPQLWSQIHVVFLTVPPEDLFSPDRGIYVAGRFVNLADRQSTSWQVRATSWANFWQRGNQQVSLVGVVPERVGTKNVRLTMPRHGIKQSCKYTNEVAIRINGSKNYDGSHLIGGDAQDDHISLSVPFIREIFSPEAKLELSWQPRGTIEHLYSGVTQRITTDVGVRVHGNMSRVFPQKSFRIYNSPSVDTSSCLSPSSGNDEEIFLSHCYLMQHMYQRTGLNDVIGQELARNLTPRIETQDAKPAQVFVNGEHWGSYFLRTRYDDRYFSDKFSLRQRDITLLSSTIPACFHNEGTKAGPEHESSRFNSLDRFIFDQKTVDDAVLAKLEDRVDLTKVSARFVIGIYLNCDDFFVPYHTLFWRNRSRFENRWHPVIIDMDGAFGLYSQMGPDVSDLMRQLNPRSLEDEIQFPQWMRTLVTNRSFRDRLINQFADAMNSVFLPEVAIEIVDQAAGAFPRELVIRHIERWQHLESIEQWNEEVENMRNFLRRRPPHMRRHVIETFDLDGTFDLTLSVDPTEGHMQVNSLEILKTTPGATDPGQWTGVYFSDVPITVTAIPHKGYRFVGWKDRDDTNATLTLTTDTDTKLEPLFEPIARTEFETSID